ncbi:MAG: hypothetical protein R2712_09080 [Vicinamibacterales bacterium]
MDNLCHIREFVPFWMEEARRIAAGTGDAWGLRTPTPPALLP